MLKFLLFIILFFVFLLLIAGVGILGSIFRFLFGSSANRNNKTGQNPQSPERWKTSEKKKEKIFSKDEGEYIDFEEIKEDNKNTD